MNNISSSAIIHKGVNIHDTAIIGEYSIIYPGVTIEQNVVVGSHCIIGKSPTKGRNQTDLVKGVNRKTIIHPNSIISDSVIIYNGVEICSYCYLADKSFIRENSFIDVDSVIGTGAVISFNCKIGKRVKIMTGCNIAGNMVINNDSFIGVHVCCVTDNNPFKMESRDKHKGPIIGKKVFVGSNCTLLPNIKIADEITVAAGSIVTKDLTKQNSLYMGSPCRFIKKSKKTGNEQNS